MKSLICLTIVFLITFTGQSQSILSGGNRNSIITSSSYQADDFSQTIEVFPLDNRRKLDHAKMKTFSTSPILDQWEATEIKIPGQQSVIQIFDSIYYWDLEISGNEWIYHGKYIEIIYDDNYNIISKFYKLWEPDQWVNRGLQTYTFDSDNNLIGVLFQTWKDSLWENTAQYVYTFDTNNNKTSELYQYWNDSVWENSALRLFTYDSNNNQTIFLAQSWYDSIWENSFRAIYSYDEDNNMINDLEQMWDEGNWINIYFWTLSYDLNNYLISALSQDWNDSIWENSILLTYTYDANYNLTMKLLQGWGDGTWTDADLNTYTYDLDNSLINALYQWKIANVWVNLGMESFQYDDNNNLTSSLYQHWREEAWKKLRYFTYTYDANNFKLNEVKRYWKEDGTGLERADSTYYYFHTIIVGINDLVVFPRSISIYPNPSSSRFTISFNLDRSTQGSLEVLNGLGQVVAVILDESLPQGNHQVTWNAEGMPSGIYFYRLTTGEQSSTGKLVIAR